MTLTEMLSRVRTVVHDSAGGYITDDDITDWINEGYADVVRRTKLLQKEYSASMGDAGTSVANGTIDLPSDFLAFLPEYSLRLGTDDAVPVDNAAFWTYSDDAEDPGVPIFRTFADKIEIYPKPATGTAFKLRYVYRPADLTAGGDTPSIPADLHQKLVKFAQAQAKLKEGQEGVSDRYRADYEQDLPVPDHRNRLFPGPLTMTVEPSYWDREGQHL